LVLITIIYKKGKPTLPVLFFAGMLFGLYEAYITKILWNPDWNLEAIRLGGVAVFTTITLILFWHVFFSFIIPIFIVENMFTKSSNILNLLPYKFKKLFINSKKYKILLLLFFISIGIIIGGQIQNPISVLISIISSILLFFITRFLWIRKIRDYKFEELLPNKKEFIFLCVLLILYYVMTFKGFRYEYLPNLQSQASIWLIYTITIIFFIKALNKSKKIQPTNDIILINYSNKRFLFYLTLFLIIGICSSLIAIYTSIIAIVLIWGLGGIFGIWLLISSIKKTL
ncbi:hypothetical protein HN415_08300, partial [Candidatus Woesearchaeota archaeon]|nr:hypothetical protein [Candidatus Woesearchaeota archaeon]